MFLSSGRLIAWLDPLASASILMGSDPPHAVTLACRLFPVCPRWSMGKPNKMVKRAGRAKRFLLLLLSCFVVNGPLHCNVSMLLCEIVQISTEEFSTWSALNICLFFFGLVNLVDQRCIFFSHGIVALLT